MKVKRITPLLNHIITTANVYPESEISGDISTNDDEVAGQIKPYQTVVGIGPNVRTINVGDLVYIDGKNYARPVHKAQQDSVTGLMTDDKVEMLVQFPIIEINGIPHLFLFDTDCQFVINDWSDEDISENDDTML